MKSDVLQQALDPNARRDVKGAEALAYTPTADRLPRRFADFDTLGEALDYAAQGVRGLNFHNPRGQLVRAYPYAELREDALDAAYRLIAAGVKPGDRIAMTAETSPEFAALFFGTVYAGAWPVPLPLPTSFGGRDSYIDQLAVQMRSAEPSILFFPEELSGMAAAAAEAVGVKGIAWEHFAEQEAPRAPLPEAGPADIAKMRSTLGGLGLGEVQLQQFGAPTDVLIRIAEQPGGDAAQQAAVQKVRGALGNEVEYRRVEVVGPRVSGELLSYGIIGLMLAIFGILIYLWFRFEWQFAVGAMIANTHDLVLTLGFMSLTRIDFDLTSIAALLTILGYSLNDTVVIYDRIREMLRRYKKMPMADLLNISVNSTLSRSIITHVTTTLALLALFLFGGKAISSFTATMMFGVVLVGTYTSVFIAAPILIYLGVGTGRDSLTSDKS